MADDGEDVIPKSDADNTATDVNVDAKEMKSEPSSQKSSRRRKDHHDSEDDNGNGNGNGNGSKVSASEGNRDRDRRRRRKRDDRKRSGTTRTTSSRSKRKRKDSSSSSRRRRRSRSSRKEDRKRRDRDRDRRKKRRRRYSSSSDDSDTSSSESDSSSSSSSEEETQSQNKKTKVKKVVNQRLLQKLAERNETLEEREERRAARKQARITAQFGYTPQDNPFNDPNLAETFTWKKKEEADVTKVKKVKDGHDDHGDHDVGTKKSTQDKIIDEIEKVRKRRRDYEESKEEMERIRAEESRMKELENYDEWAKKEDLFHLQQQRHRSAIRLVEGREKPIDVLAKNLLMFGLTTTDQEKDDRAKVKYKEKYNAMDELEHLEAELEEPHVFLKDLKMKELEEMLTDINAFCMLEQEACDDEDNDNGAHGAHDSETQNVVLTYWQSLQLVTKAEIQKLRQSSHHGKEDEVKTKTKLEKDIQNMFEGQSMSALEKMKDEVEAKVKRCIMAGGRPVFDEDEGGVIDLKYWQTVLDELLIQLAKMELSNIHSKMLVCQLEQLEKRKEQLAEANANASSNATKQSEQDAEDDKANQAEEEARDAAVPNNVAPDFGNLEEELGLTNEFDLGIHSSSYVWQDKYRPRKPRYFNRVKTGYDWNKYNQTHYDHDNPPPKTVQGYKFNIFYPDLIDRTVTPKYFLEPTKTQEFCIIRFRAGPPYEDIAFKIINREWNRSRKRGFKCTFERGILSLYFNFKTHWYRK